MRKANGQELIPLSHKCVACGNNKEKVNFEIAQRAKCKVARPVCGNCKYKKVKASDFPESKETIVAYTPPYSPVKYSPKNRLRHEFNLYFKEVTV